MLKSSKGKGTNNTQGKPHTFNIWSLSRNSTGQKGMAGYIWSAEREKSTTKITVPGKDLIQNWWRNQKLFRQAQFREFSTTISALKEMLNGLI